MKLPEQKTKIVATIGPASASREVMEAMIKAGMNVARINFSHGDFQRPQTGDRQAPRGRPRGWDGESPSWPTCPVRR